MLNQILSAKQVMLWLTTAVSILSVLPQLECICPNGSKHKTYSFTNLHCGCVKHDCPTSQITPTSKPENQCCKAIKPRCPNCQTVEDSLPASIPNDSQQTCSTTHCRKSLSLPDIAMMTTVTVTQSDSEFAMVIPSVCGWEYSFSDNQMQNHQSPTKDPPIPPDLVITLRHFVI
jgi:hypothetical protein